MQHTSITQRFLAPLALSLMISLPALALELGDAKTQGLVGETNAGYLAAVKPSGEVNTLVESINKQRKAQYQKIAKKNGISLEAVEVRAGKKAIEKTQPGEYVNTGGGWQKK